MRKISKPRSIPALKSRAFGIKWGKLVATLFFIGYVPLAPGTLASLFGAGLYFLVKENEPLYLFITAILLVVGFWASSRAEKAFRKKDPPQIVIDEFSSVLLVYLFVPFSVMNLAIGFALFRIFDIAKIPPIKKLQALPSGWGIMLDDVAAAFLTNIILRILTFF